MLYRPTTLDTAWLPSSWTVICPSNRHLRISSIACPSTANSPLLGQSSVNPIPILLSALYGQTSSFNEGHKLGNIKNRVSIIRQSFTNRMPILCQSTANHPPIIVLIPTIHRLDKNSHTVNPLPNVRYPLTAANQQTNWHHLAVDWQSPCQSTTNQRRPKPLLT